MLSNFSNYWFSIANDNFSMTNFMSFFPGTRSSWDYLQTRSIGEGWVGLAYPETIGCSPWHFLIFSIFQQGFEYKPWREILLVEFHRLFCLNTKKSSIFWGFLFTPTWKICSAHPEKVITLWAWLSIHFNGPLWKVQTTLGTLKLFETCLRLLMTLLHLIKAVQDVIKPFKSIFAKRLLKPAKTVHSSLELLWLSQACLKLCIRL